MTWPSTSRILTSVHSSTTRAGARAPSVAIAPRPHGRSTRSDGQRWFRLPARSCASGWTTGPTSSRWAVSCPARETPARLRNLVHDSADALRADLADLTPAALERTIVTAQGRRLAASEIAWLRSRELAVHAVDLDAGVTFGDLPDDLGTALVHDVITKRLASGEGAALTAWLTGRADSGLPLGPWL